MFRPARRLGATTVLALVAGLAAVAPASAATATCGPAPVVINNNEVNQAPVAVADTAVVTGGSSVEIPVLANDTDPDGNALSLVTAGRPTRGSACTTAKGTIRYTPEGSQQGYSTTFTYGMTDGDRYRTATVTVEVGAVKAVTVQVRRKLVVKRGKVTRAAQVAFTNPNAFAVEVVFAGRRSGAERTVGAGKTIVTTTREKQLNMISYTGDEETDIFIINEATADTRTGRVRSQYVGESPFGWESDDIYRATRTLR